MSKKTLTNILFGVAIAEMAIVTGIFITAKLVENKDLDTDEKEEK